MKATTFLTALALTGIAPLAVADNCQAGLHYCGSTFLSKGRYYDQIVAALSGKAPADQITIEESDFYCVGGANGEIAFQAYCSGGCVDGGSGNSD